MPASLDSWSAKVSALLVPLLFSPGTISFGTVDGVLSQHAEHEMITRLALECPEGEKSDGICFEPVSLDNLAGTNRGPGIGRNGAVGSPDNLLPEGGEAHCDDADFLDIPGYPRSRDEATTTLQTCVSHLRVRFSQGYQAAGRLLSGDGLIVEDMVSLEEDCVFEYEALDINPAGRAKCNVLEGLGRALHGVQDFYAHSNWADRANPDEPIGIENPPGLELNYPPGFLDLRMRTAIRPLVPRDLSTGCFAINPVSTFCDDRITHGVLNKDHGEINDDGSYGDVGQGTPRGQIPGNFQSAVRLAVQNTRETWRRMQSEIKTIWGEDKGNLMICALVRDDPMKDCRTRKISIIVDSSGSNTRTDPDDLRIAAAREVNAQLSTVETAGSAADQVSLIEFDDLAKILYPMGDPSRLTFDGIDSDGGTFIGAGIYAGIREILMEEPGAFANKSGLVVLTDGEDQNPNFQLAQLRSAAENGIRVNYGRLSPPELPVARRSIVKRAPSIPIISTILSTGGVFAVINSAEAQGHFVDLVLSRGLTDIDGAVGDIRLVSGVAISGLLKTGDGPHRFVYHADNGENMAFNVQALAPIEGVLTAILRDVRQGVEVARLEMVSEVSGEPATMNFTASGGTELEMMVYTNTTGDDPLVFTVELLTDMPFKEEDPATSSVAAVESTSATVPSSTLSSQYSTSLEATSSSPLNSSFAESSHAETTAAVESSSLPQSTSSFETTSSIGATPSLETSRLETSAPAISATSDMSTLLDTTSAAESLPPEESCTSAEDGESTSFTTPSSPPEPISTSVWLPNSGSTDLQMSTSRSLDGDISTSTDAPTTSGDEETTSSMRFFTDQSVSYTVTVITTVYTSICATAITTTVSDGPATWVTTMFPTSTITTASTITLGCDEGCPDSLGGTTSSSSVQDASCLRSNCDTDPLAYFTAPEAGCIEESCETDALSNSAEATSGAKPSLPSSIESAEGSTCEGDGCPSNTPGPGDTQLIVEPVPAPTLDFCEGQPCQSPDVPLVPAGASALGWSRVMLSVVLAVVVIAR